MPPWVPLVAAVLGLVGALAAILYARHTISMACDRLRTAQGFENRLLKLLSRHPEILGLAREDELPPRVNGIQRTPFGDVSEAEGLLSGSTNAEPSDWHDWQSLTLLLIAQGRFEEAQAGYRCALELGSQPTAEADESAVA